MRPIQAISTFAVLALITLPAFAQSRQIVFFAGHKDHGGPGRHELREDLRALAWL